MDQPILVVSGPPRSGTSLMMQILEAAGVELLCDDVRTPDPSNPRGYYELEAVKALARDASFLEAASGKAVKIIHALLPRLPQGYQYAVLMMERDLDEVLASQEKMRSRLVGPEAATPSVSKDALRSVFEKQIAAAHHWAEASPGVELLRVPHRALITKPEAATQEIARFLEIAGWSSLDPQAMSDAVDPELYRQRS
ncbi:MAG: sulfotransferase family protein [Planctomycetota bacterium]